MVEINERKLALEDKKIRILEKLGENQLMNNYNYCSIYDYLLFVLKLRLCIFIIR